MIRQIMLSPLLWIPFFLGCATLSNTPEVIQKRSKPDHGLWDTVVQKYVDESGNVDYKTLKEQPGAVLGYLDHLSGFPPALDWSRADSLAYYINLYNAATVKLILEHYPVSSIKDIPKPWSSQFVLIDGDKVSLGYLEHRVLRKMNEPRIHFAINCASFSCPRLWDQAFTPEKIEVQLETVTREFIRDIRYNELSSENWEISQIFNWYKGDFKSQGGIRTFITSYIGAEPDPEIKITYKKYDWSLNEAQ